MVPTKAFSRKYNKVNTDIYEEIKYVVMNMGEPERTEYLIKNFLISRKVQKI